MNKQIRLKHPIIKMLNNSLIDLPSPSNINMWWNFGSLLGLCLIIQIITGVFLTMHYSASILIAFDSVVHICRDVNYGWLIRSMHANGASFVFFCIYAHIGRGIYFGLYKSIQTWSIGVILLFLMMGTAFMGYVLPWGQMSFWGATVITNILSAIPYLGNDLVQWIWGGFAVDGATLSRFYSFHFIIPFITIAVSIIHLMFLHENGSMNPMGLNSSLDKIPFHSFYSLKDLFGFLILFILLINLTLLNPYYLGDPDNFIPANPLVTPEHIQPEWYFLFAYAILRSIPNKLGGVIALIFSIAILFLLPFLNYKNKVMSTSFYPINKILFWSLISLIILLTWIGARPVEAPFIIAGQMFTILYFFMFIIIPFLAYYWDKFIFYYK